MFSGIERICQLGTWVVGASSINHSLSRHSTWVILPRLTPTLTCPPLNGSTSGANAMAKYFRIAGRFHTATAEA